MTVTITAAAGKLSVASPFNARFPERARNLGGKWEGGAWLFDQRVEADVRALCVELYGTDGAAPADVVDVRVFITDAEGWGRIPFKTNFLTVTLAGRPVARAFDRDSGARTNEGVIVRQGGWTSGGSKRNPCIKLKDATDTEVEVLDVPRAAAEALIAEFPTMVSIIPRAVAPAAAEAPTTVSVPLSAEDVTALVEALRATGGPEALIGRLQSSIAA